MRGLSHRQPGTAGAALAMPEILAEMICDGVHLDPLIVKLVVAAKGRHGVALITDAIEGAAMPDGEYQLGGFTIYVREGRAVLPDGTLAGSVLTMNRAFHNVQRFADIDPVHAADLTSGNAARQLGFDGRYGEIAPGRAADIAIVDPSTGEVEWTVIGGQIAYRR
jgi:N-acetylglucosamine-6-phosphate deacetylase